MIKQFLKKIIPKSFLIFYRKNRLFLEYFKFRIILQLYRIKNKDILIIVGSAYTNYDSWISTNYPYVNITNLETIKRNFKKKEVSRILAEHVFEHLTLEDGIKSIKNLKSIIKSKGVIRIAVPDGYNPNEDYINDVKPGGIGAGSDDHKILYNYNSIKKLFDSDFEIKLLEYFDENGNFISNDWNNDEKNGYIMRSRLNDRRNSKHKIYYNSIILDATLMK